MLTRSIVILSVAFGVPATNFTDNSGPRASLMCSRSTMPVISSDSLMPLPPCAPSAAVALRAPNSDTAPAKHSGWSSGFEPDGGLDRRRIEAQHGIVGADQLGLLERAHDEGSCNFGGPARRNAKPLKPRLEHGGCR